MGKKRRKKNEPKVNDADWWNSQKSDSWPWAAFQPSQNRNTLSYKRERFARESIGEMEYYRGDKKVHAYVISAINNWEPTHSVALVWDSGEDRLIMVHISTTGIVESNGGRYEA